MRVVNSDGATFSAEFNAALVQAARYRDFAISNRDYLYREKGMDFDDPSAILIAGFNLRPDERKLLRLQERSSVVKIFTYNDIIAQMTNTLELQRLAKLSPVQDKADSTEETG